MSVPAEKYCALVESEGGIQLLQQLLAHPAPYATVKELAQLVINNCAAHAARTAAGAGAPAVSAPRN